MWGFVRCLRKDTLSGQKQQATHAASSTKKAYWKDTGSYQRNKVQQGYSSLIRNGKLSSTAVFSAWLSFWTPLFLPLCSSLSCVLFKQFRSAFPKAQPQPPAQVCMPYSPEPITIELTQSLSINSKHLEETLLLGSSAWQSFQLLSLPHPHIHQPSGRWQVVLKTVLSRL